MDRYVIRERRPGTEYPQGNQMMPFSPSSAAGNNITIPDVYYGACEMPGVQRTGYANVNMNTQHFVPNNLVQNPAAMVSGIDPRYLAAYSSNNGPFIAGQQMHQEQVIFPEDVAFGSNYQNRNLVPVEKVTPKPFQQQRFSAGATGVPPTEHRRFEPQPIRVGNYANQNNLDTAQKAIPTNLGATLTTNAHFEPQSRRVSGNYTKMKDLETPQKVIATNAATTRKQSEVNLLKNEAQSQVRTRSEKLKALHKSGPRAFSGPVEKVLKWHKSLQDIGLLVLYEIVAKCVSVRPGERCAKNIVVRDDSGPAIQVVYYEVDFLLPELKPPCTIRVIGRMIPGTCRLQAFNVRLATGDDVATLPRRAAVAAHHVAKLAKEYGKDSDKTTIVLP